MAKLEHKFTTKMEDAGRRFFPPAREKKRKLLSHEQEKRSVGVLALKASRRLIYPELRLLSLITTWLARLKHIMTDCKRSQNGESRKQLLDWFQDGEFPPSLVSFHFNLFVPAILFLLSYISEVACETRLMHLVQKMRTTLKVPWELIEQGISYLVPLFHMS